MPDFGFVGASYTTRSIYQDDQECINYYPEIDPTKQPGERGIVALYPTPGLVTEITFPISAEVRGMRALSGLQYAIAVCGNRVYRIDTSLGYTQVGTLTTNTGPVSISDNQMTTQGLTAYIVDGTNRYYYEVLSNTFVQLPLTDGPWQGASVTDVVDGYVIYNEPNTQNWSSTDLDSPLSTQAWFGTKNGSPDPIVSLIVDHRQVYLLGEVTTEVWVDVVSEFPVHHRKTGAAPRFPWPVMLIRLCFWPVTPLARRPLALCKATNTNVCPPTRLKTAWWALT